MDKNSINIFFKNLHLSDKISGKISVMFSILSDVFRFDGNFTILKESGVIVEVLSFKSRFFKY